MGTRYEMRDEDETPVLLREVRTDEFEWVNRTDGSLVMLSPVIKVVDGRQVEELHVTMGYGGDRVTVDPGGTLHVALHPGDVGHGSSAGGSRYEVSRGKQGKPIMSPEDYEYIAANPRVYALVDWLADANRKWRNINLFLAGVLLVSIVVGALA